MPRSGLLAALVAEKELELECQGRAPRAVAPTVVDSARLAGLRTTMFPEGTILCFVAERDSNQIERIKEIVDGGDLDAIDGLAAELTTMEADAFSSASGRSSIEAHLVDVRYGATPLGRGLAPSLVPVAVSRAIWNGGDLDPAKFAAIDFVREATAPEVDVLIVLCRPTLTELEEATVRAVPTELDEVHVKGPSLSWTPAARAGVLRMFDEDGSPLFQHANQQHTQHQEQQQQEDTRHQQQQQQHQQDDRQHQEQQQQQQDLDRTMQQQQQQHQDMQETRQNQDQIQQDRQTHDQAHHYQQDRQTHQEMGVSRYRGLLDEWEGIAPDWFDRDDYLQLLRSNDFSTLDATQSARALLGLREQLLKYGMP